MIPNLTPQSTAVDILEKLPHTFYLGGSRRMAAIALETKNAHINIRENTDYDFYTTWTKAVVQDLEAAGFVHTSTTYEYFDDETCDVMARDNVQVVLRKNATFYHNVFENIDPQFYHDFLWKSSSVHPKPEADQIRRIFNQLFATARGALFDNTSWTILPSRVPGPHPKPTRRDQF